MSRLSSEGRRWLLGVARAALEAAGDQERFQTPRPPADLPEADRKELERPLAAFVSLHKADELRGCVGHVEADLPLRQVVAEMAQAAALDDTRFSPVTRQEIAEIDVEISVLSPFFPITREEIVPGVHGLAVRQGRRRGLLLPQVAATLHWNAEQFLEETCRKAGLPRDAWKRGAVVEAFTAEVFGEQECKRHARRAS